jgi:hypothetical protein
MGSSKSSAGLCGAQSHLHPRPPQRMWWLHNAYPRRNRRMAPSDQWRRSFSRANRSCLGSLRCRDGVPDATKLPTFPLPSYPEIYLSFARASDVLERLARGQYDAVHIATEGPIGFAARRACMRRGYAFTTSYHTRFPEYVRARVPVPVRWTYAWLRRFHNAGRGHNDRNPNATP